MSVPVEQKLYDAARKGDAAEVESLLRNNPGLNVNSRVKWRMDRGGFPLHIASISGHVEVVKLLLAHPDINVNLKNSAGETPILRGCRERCVSVVLLLLKDPRVDITLDDNHGRTPLWLASGNGLQEVIERFIASGRNLGDVENKKGEEWWSMGEEFTALEVARNRERTKAVSLLERFIANPTLTRHELRVKYGVLNEFAAEVFALTVFLCDDLLQLKLTVTPNPAAATRFFAILKRLPMELQMILCHFTVGSAKQNILRKDSEAAFKSLARILLGL